MRHSLLIGFLICAFGWMANGHFAQSQEPDAPVAEKSEAESELIGSEEAKTDDASQESHAKKKTESKKPKKLILASLTLKDSFPEGPAQPGIFGEISLNLHQLIERLDKVAKDEKVVGVILNFRNPTIGRGQLEELRAAIARVRNADKKVYADIQMTMQNDYLLASACDEIIMPPSGLLTIPGVRMEVTFFKDLLDKIGVQADMMQVGDFKGAAEPMTRSEMSPEFRAQLERLVDDYYEQMVETIAADRKLEKDKVRNLIDEGIFTPERAKAAKLIDRVAYEDEIKVQLKEQLGAEELSIVRDYGKKEIDTDFSGIAGMMKFMELITGGEQKSRTSNNKKVAVIYAVGAIVPGPSSSGMFANVVGSDTIIKALRKAEEDDKVVAIVLRVDSPGGSALASDLMWREITRIEKPIIASMGDTAASGGYYISMGADKIFAEAGTLTGSIGVVGGKMTLKGLMEKVGVNAEVVSRGKNSGWLSPTQPFTESEREAWKTMMTEIYEQFTTKAAEGRKMELETLRELAQGKLYTGRMAVENKLVDAIGTLDDAVAEAKKFGGVKAEEKVDLMILPEPRSIFDELFGGPELETRVRALVPEVADHAGQLEIIRKLFTEPAVTLMPYEVKIH